MKRESIGMRSIVGGLLIAAFCFAGLPTPAQDLVPVSDMSGGSSVFVFRASAKAAPKHFATTARPSRSQAQLREAAVRIKKQYEARGTSDPGRVHTKVVDPNAGLPNVRTMPKDQAAKLFAGVGEYYIDKGMLDNSIDSFRDAISMDDKNVAGHMGLSDALTRKGNDLLVKDQ